MWMKMKLGLYLLIKKNSVHKLTKGYENV
jgi:hypothetical protein